MKNQFLIYTTFLFMCLKLILCDIEYANNENQDEFDSSSNNQKLLNTETNMCNITNSRKLWEFFDTKIDLNKDSIIDQIEIENYLLNRIKQMHKDEIVDQINRLDVNKTGKIDFNAYIKDTFENLYDTNILENDTPNEEYEELKHLYEIEKQKWLHLSNSLNQTLTFDQFYQFVYSEEFPNLKEFEETTTFNIYDKNKDGFLTVQEFLESSRNIDETVVTIKENKFTNTIDINQDNMLDLNEFKLWHKQIVPSLEETVYEEKVYLLNCCDENKNGVLNKIEIEKYCKSLLNSLITNYGIDLNTYISHNVKLNDEL